MGICLSSQEVIFPTSLEANPRIDNFRWINVVIPLFETLYASWIRFCYHNIQITIYFHWNYVCVPNEWSHLKKAFKPLKMRKKGAKKDGGSNRFQKYFWLNYLCVNPSKTAQKIVSLPFLKNFCIKIFKLPICFWKLCNLWQKIRKRAI